MRTATGQRLRVTVRGAVQGVGFRPFVYRLATGLKLNGRVSNSTQGVFIEAEGALNSLREFLLRIQKEKPPRAVILCLESSFIDAVGYSGFEICESEDLGDKTALILPDIATCGDCLQEILDPSNRRFRYPFTNCTNCGPRFSIIEALPYDRPNTSMKKFTMCADCAREYHDPFDRRFHAQPNACPKCGPQLRLVSEDGAVIGERDNALHLAADAVRAAKIVALKGLGGFQLIVDARNEAAVVRMRERKHREEKPFALMYPSLQSVRADCEVSELEKRLLLSPESPIVLLRQNCRASESLAPATGAVALQSVAPRNPNLGVMLPYTGLHYLLMSELDFPVVATSGNLSDEPICIDEHEALNRLLGIADLFLVHDRPIVRHVDDSMVRVTSGRELVLRRARGYAPLPIILKSDNKDRRVILGVGAHLKNSVALKIDNNIFVSQHIGDLETKQAYGAFCREAADLPRLYDAKVEIVACDSHPDYLSTKHADEIASEWGAYAPRDLGSLAKAPKRAREARALPIQHHWAHVAGCMAENEIEAPVLGVAWDGTGYGLDGTIWGGEFLLGKQDGSFERVAHLRQFCLPGGDAAIRQPRRTALGLLYEMFADATWDRHELRLGFPKMELTLIQQMLEKKINAPRTSSAGRLFDAVAALIGLRHVTSFEGQAAMELEFALHEGIRAAYSFVVSDTTPMIVDWEPAIRELLADMHRGEQTGVISAKFHNMLIEAITAIARKIGQARVVLTGGCFQNRYLTERAVELLCSESFRPYCHQRIPPNDGGIALGQVVAASWTRE